MSCSTFRLAPKSRVALSRAAASAEAVPHTLAGRSKSETYAEISRMLDKFLAKYPVDTVGRMATINSFLHANFPRMNFVGFYTVLEPGVSLQVGPYQGEVLACGTIEWGKGVCGTAASTGKTQLVHDVHAIENYIACDEETMAEVVVPVFSSCYHNEKPGSAGGEGTAGQQKKLIAVLDIDGDAVGAFDAEDVACLEALCARFF